MLRDIHLYMRPSTNGRHSDGDTRVFFKQILFHQVSQLGFQLWFEIEHIDIRACIFTDLNIQIPARFLVVNNINIKREPVCDKSMSISVQATYLVSQEQQ